MRGVLACVPLAFTLDLDPGAIRTAGDWQSAIRLNKQFHFSLADIGQMPVLRGLLGGLWLQIGPPISSFHSLGGRDMIDHHHPVYEAIRLQDAGAARLNISNDIACSVEGIIAHIDKTSDTGSIA